MGAPLRSLAVEQEPYTLRSRDYLLGVLGLASLRDLFRSPEQVLARTAEMQQVVEHADEFPFDIDVEFAEHDVVDGYRKWSAVYDVPGVNPAILAEEALTDPMLATIPPGRALDVACGTGRVVGRLLALGHEVHGIDATDAMVDRARERHPAAQLDVGDWGALPFDDGAFDLVTSSLALCHAPDLAVPLREMARVLRPGGRLVISDMHPVATQLGGAAGFPGDGPGHLPFVRNHPHSLSAQFRALAEVGLTVEQMGEGEFTAEHAALMQSHPVFPEGTERALVGLPMIVAWSAHK